MRYLKYLALLLALLALPALHSQAQVAIGVGINIGPNYGVYHAPPVCEWGFYPDYPFGCAPYGYYGPDWFTGGVFIGAGPWFHGPARFSGHVDNRFDPHHGYRGPMPARGDEPHNHFRGNEARDGKGHVTKGDHEGGGERALPGHQGGGGGRR